MFSIKISVFLFGVFLAAKDLILWEFVRVPSFPSCRVKLSLGCGQEIGIHVPNTCTNMAQPASFVGSVEKLMAIPRPSDSNDTNQTGAWRTSIFLVKFFDDGGCFIEGPGPLLAL